MDKVTFGVTVTIIGMGGTLLSLAILSLFMSLLKKLFPYHPPREKTQDTRG